MYFLKIDSPGADLLILKIKINIIFSISSSISNLAIFQKNCERDFLFYSFVALHTPCGGYGTPFQKHVIS